MSSLDINHIAPNGPHLEGFIRFSYEEGEGGERTQRPQFELLSREHEHVPQAGEIPKMKTHPLADQMPAADGPNNERLNTEIPITFFSRTPEGNLIARYEAVDTMVGRVVCSGNGTTATRRTMQSAIAESVQCAGPDHCQFAQGEGVSCKLHTRLRVHVEGSTDPLGVFEFQSTGINSYRAIASKLKMLHGLFDDLRGLPLRLTSWAKSSPASGYSTFYAANIELREGVSLIEAKQKAQEYLKEHATLNLDGLDKAISDMAALAVSSVGEMEETVVTSWTPAALIRNRPRMHQTNTNEGFADCVTRAVQMASQTSAAAIAAAADTSAAPPVVLEAGSDKIAAAPDSPNCVTPDGARAGSQFIRF